MKGYHGLENLKKSLKIFQIIDRGHVVEDKLCELAWRHPTLFGIDGLCFKHDDKRPVALEVRLMCLGVLARHNLAFNGFEIIVKPAHLRSFQIPETVNAKAIDAKYLNGILTLTLPKKEEAKADSVHTIEIG